MNKLIRLKTITSLLAIVVMPQALLGQNAAQNAQAMSLQQALNKAIKDRETSVTNFKKNHVADSVDEKVLAAQLLELKNDQEKKDNRQVSSEIKTSKETPEKESGASKETEEPELELEE